MYLPEWIDYHSHLGVGQFYLYDNGPGPEVTRLIDYRLLVPVYNCCLWQLLYAAVDAATAHALEPWVRRGLVTYSSTSAKHTALLIAETAS
eukprot:16140-Heterococcus_DN1.PRE.1